MIHLELVNLGGERKSVEVVEALPLPRLVLKWGLSGTYVLDISRNYVQRHKQWKAKDPIEAKKIWTVLRREYVQGLVDKGVIKVYTKPSEYQAMLSVVCFLTKWVYQS